MYHSTENLILKLRHYCAYQDRSQQEVEQKLFKLGANEQQSGEVILHLIQEGFLNEERFAKSYARGKFRMQQWGRMKIINGLRSKNVSEPLIQIALKEIDEEEYLKTLEHLIRKFYGKSEDVQKTKQNLLARGFEYELVLSVIGFLDL
ncbi:MAG: RecX family transcriptional regulator [Saprospiraceae bacterium]|nr:RecX family transcriptional regulator [Saprospiraceae bacterium]